MKKNKINLWGHPNLVKIIIHLDSCESENITNASRYLGMTNNNSSILFKKLKEMKLIVVKKTEGKRSIFYKLTKKGQKVAKNLIAIDRA